MKKIDLLVSIHERLISVMDITEDNGASYEAYIEVATCITEMANTGKHTADEILKAAYDIDGAIDVEDTEMIQLLNDYKTFTPEAV